MFGGEFSRSSGGVEWGFLCLEIVALPFDRGMIEGWGVLECVAADKES